MPSFGGCYYDRPWAPPTLLDLDCKVVAGAAFDTLVDVLAVDSDIIDRVDLAATPLGALIGCFWGCKGFLLYI